MLQVFYYALKAVVYPMAPVFNLQANDGIGTLTPLCVKALKRIFLMSDLDKASTLALFHAESSHNLGVLYFSTCSCNPLSDAQAALSGGKICHPS